VTLDWPVVLFSVGASAVAALLFGLAPAIQSGFVSVSDGLKEGNRSAMGGRGGRTLRSLVALEVAVSLVLLAGAALMVKTFVHLQDVRPGFEPKGLLTFNVTRNIENREAFAAFSQEVAQAIRSTPGVEFAGATSQVPFSGGRFNGPWAWDEESEANWMSHRAAFRYVSGDFFRTMGTRLLAGRTFNAQELSEESNSVIVDEVLVQTAWPDKDPLGQSILATRQRVRAQVVGVVEHVRHRRLDSDHYGTMYFPAYWGGGTQLVRTAGDPMALVGPLRSALGAISPDVVMYQVHPMEELVATQLAPTRFALLLMGVFSGLALILAAVGLYGVISYAVRQRTAEIGVRMALGADRGRILGMVIREGLVLVGLGVLGGLAGALALARFIRGLLFGVEATDPVTLITVTFAVAVVGLVALLLPAARGAHTDPVVALRME
jgi:putative ABC transport system permease protein